MIHNTISNRSYKSSSFADARQHFAMSDSPNPLSQLPKNPTLVSGFFFHQDQSEKYILVSETRGVQLFLFTTEVIVSTLWLTVYSKIKLGWGEQKLNWCSDWYMCRNWMGALLFLLFLGKNDCWMLDFLAVGDDSTHNPLLSSCFDFIAINLQSTIISVLVSYHNLDYWR